MAEFISIRKLTPDSLLKNLSEQDGGAKLLADRYGIALEAYIMSIRLSRFENNNASTKYQAIKDSEHASEEEKLRANKMIEELSHISFSLPIDFFGYLIRRIEIASQFS